MASEPASGCYGLIFGLVPILVVVVIGRRIVRSVRPSGGGKYRRIKAWLKERHGLSFGKDSDTGSIRMQLEMVLQKERDRLSADYESRRESIEEERKKKRWRKPFDVDKRLSGFKAFIEKQDYSVLVK